MTSYYPEFRLGPEASPTFLQQTRRLPRNTASIAWSAAAGALAKQLDIFDLATIRHE
jgi:hypothetical protein